MRGLVSGTQHKSKIVLNLSAGVWKRTDCGAGPILLWAIMPTYFFKFRSGTRIEEDPEGVELPDIVAAQEEAIGTAREIVANAIKFSHDDLPDHIIISDGDNQTLSIVPLSDVLPRSLRK